MPLEGCVSNVAILRHGYARNDTALSALLSHVVNTVPSNQRERKHVLIKECMYVL